MPDTQTDMSRTPGSWLAAGNLLLAAALVLHGPPDPDLTIQMHSVHDGHGLWSLVHWSAAVALFLISGASFLTLATDRRVRQSPALASAWTVMALGALTTFSTAISEATVLSAAADAGDLATFTAWWGFATGMANGFFALALATALVAWSDMRSDIGRLPVWAAGAGTLFGLFSAIGWTLGEQLGLAIGGPVWLVSSLLMCLWLAWYGLAPFRAAAAATAPGQA